MEEAASYWRRYGLLLALAAFLATRAIVLLVAWTAPQDRERQPELTWWSPIPTMRWDAGHYAYILEHGYPRENGQLPGPPASDAIAFFPLYPLLAWPLTRFMSSHAALVVLAHAASLLAMVFLYLWSRRRHGPRVAFWCVVLLSVYPAGMFFSAGYADGLLVLWVALALWLLDKDRVWGAAAVSALATATRPTGLCLAAIVVLWGITRGPRPPWPRRNAGRHSQSNEHQHVSWPTLTNRIQGNCGWTYWLFRTTAIGLISVAGLIAFQLYLWHYYGRPDAFVAVQDTWQPGSSAPQPLLELVTLKPLVQPAFKPFKYTVRGLYHLVRLHTGQAGDQFRRLLDPTTWNPLLNLTLVVAAVVGLLRPGPIPRILFLLPILVFVEAWLPDPYRGSRMIGIARYQLIALPAFLLLAGWLALPRRAFLRYGVCAALLVLQCIYIAVFANWYLVS